MTWFRASAMFPFCWQLPMWTCEMCDEFACSPVILRRTVICPGGAVTEIVPLAFARTPLSLKVRGAGPCEAEGVGDAARVGEGEGVGLLTGPPHPATMA